MFLFTLVDLADRALGPGGAAGLDLGPHAEVGPRPAPFLGVERHQLVAHDRVVPPAGTALGPSGGPPAKPPPRRRSTDAADPTGRRARHHLTLAGQRRVGDAP